MFPCAALLLLLSACGGQRVTATGGLDAFEARDARIQPGDQIALSIWREPDLEGAYTVDETGTAILPRLGAVHASEMTAGELQVELRRRYAEYLRTESVQVQVLRRIGVHGEVRRPDLYRVDLTVTLRDLIAQAGGVTEAGDPNDVVIVRGNERIGVGGNELAQFTTAQLRSGDQVVVGQRSLLERQPLAVVSTASAVVGLLVSVLWPLLRRAQESGGGPG